MRNTILKVVIPGVFPSLNEFIAANRVRRGDWSKGNDMKQTDQEIIKTYLRKARSMGFQSRLHPPVILNFTFYEPSRRRDPDNITGYFKKVFCDALVESGMLKNDNWVHIAGFSDRFECDPANPRIEVEIEEMA